MNFRKIATLATAGTVAVGMSVLGLVTPAFAVENPVTFEVAGGSLAIAQTPASRLLVQGTAVAMPATAVTDGRNSPDRSGVWTVTATASNLVAGSGVTLATILANQITLANTGGFTSGSGAVAEGAWASTANTIDSVYTYTPTATLAIQTLPFSGSYTGTVTQTVL